MKGLTITLLLASLCACGNSNEGQTSYAVGITDRSVTTNTFRIAVTSPESFSRLPEVFTANQPKDFRWIEVEIPAELSMSLFSDAGVTADLAMMTPAITFSQTYPEACNPRTGDYSRCYYIERLSAGAPGVTGTIRMGGTLTEVSASIDVMYEGTSTLWGEPPISYGHGTTTGFTALLNGAIE